MSRPRAWLITTCPAGATLEAPGHTPGELQDRQPPTVRCPFRPNGRHRELEGSRAEVAGQPKTCTDRLRSPHPSPGSPLRHPAAPAAGACPETVSSVEETGRERPASGATCAKPGGTATFDQTEPELQHFPRGLRGVGRIARTNAARRADLLYWRKSGGGSMECASGSDRGRDHGREGDGREMRRRTGSGDALGWSRRGMNLSRPARSRSGLVKARECVDHGQMSAS